MSRSQSIYTIEGLYGMDSDVARKIIDAVVAEMGTDAFREVALGRIAELMQQENDRHHGISAS